jgi:hypothetical protein
MKHIIKANYEFYNQKETDFYKTNYDEQIDILIKKVKNAR